MKIDIEDIKKIVGDAARMKHDIKVGDIAYLILSRTIKDKSVVYATIFGKGFDDKVPEQYEGSAKVKYLKRYLNTNYPAETAAPKKKLGKSHEISFEENRQALVANLSELEEAVKDGLIEYKDAKKMEIDIRTRLNDKFSVNDTSDEQMIMVQPKFNHICEYTQKECWLQTKEYAMRHWNLMERPEEDITTEKE